MRELKYPEFSEDNPVNRYDPTDDLNRQAEIVWWVMYVGWAAWTVLFMCVTAASFWTAIVVGFIFNMVFMFVMIFLVWLVFG